MNGCHARPSLRATLGVLLALTAVMPLAAQEKKADEISALAGRLALKLVEEERTPSMVIGVLRGGKTWTRGYGVLGPEDPRPPDGDTIHEIGSITKVFTGLLLAVAVTRGEVKLEDPVSKHLPPTWKVPVFEGKAMRLVDLATHTSGLPRMPPDFLPRNLRDPYANYGVEKLKVSLSKTRLLSAPGERHLYSNYGMGLLGQILCFKAKRDYAELVAKRITAPLGLKDTLVTLDARRRKRLAPPFPSGRSRATEWRFKALAGAGALRSTARDLLAFARAVLEPARTPLKEALALTLRVHWQGGGDAPPMGLAWHWVPTRAGVWHNGGTGGYRSFMAVNLERRFAVVVLANTTDAAVDRVGSTLMRALSRRTGG